MSTLAKVMREENDFYELRNKTIFPHAEVDIRFAEFIDWMRDNATQREKDIVYVSENLQKAFKTKFPLFHDDRNPYFVNMLNNVEESLRRLGIQYLLRNME